MSTLIDSLNHPTRLQHKHKHKQTQTLPQHKNKTCYRTHQIHSFSLYQNQTNSNPCSSLSHPFFRHGLRISCANLQDAAGTGEREPPPAQADDPPPIARPNQERSLERAWNSHADCAIYHAKNHRLQSHFPHFFLEKPSHLFRSTATTWPRDNSSSAPSNISLFNTRTRGLCRRSPPWPKRDTLALVCVSTNRRRR